MPTTSRTRTILSIIVIVIVVLIGYFLWKHNNTGTTGVSTATTTQETASSTLPAFASKGTATIPGIPAGARVSSVTVTGTRPAPEASGSFHISTGTSANLGSTIAVTNTLPSNTAGFALVYILHPVSAPGMISGVIFSISVPQQFSGTTFPISGVRLADVTDPATGNKMAIIPGTYKIEARLYERNPFNTGTQVYNKDVTIRSFTATSNTFTISPNVTSE